MKTLYWSFLLMLLPSMAYTQNTEKENEFTMSMQIRPRAEYRNGALTPRDEGVAPTSFINNRARLSMDYKRSDLELKMSAQHVGVLGDFIKEGELSVIGVAANSSETAFCYDVAFANASGLCHWEEPVSDKIRKTLYVDFELSDSQIARRYANVPDFVSCSVRRAHPVSSAHGCSPEDTIRNIEKLVEENRPELVIIDDLGALTGNAVSVSVVKKTMEGLNHIRESFELTMILVAHFRKRNGRNPIEISDIEGSSVICNYTDSIVAIGSSVEGTEIKYLKQLKTRSAQKMSEVAVMCLEDVPWLHFDFIRFDDEFNHLVNSQKSRSTITDFMGENIVRLNSEGFSIRSIAEMLGLSKSVVGRFLKDRNSYSPQLNYD